MGQDLKICKNCVHVSGSGSFAKCLKYKPEGVVDLVTGKRSGSEYYHAETVRWLNHLCGKSGKWYEAEVQKPKGPSLLQRVKLWLSK